MLLDLVYTSSYYVRGVVGAFGILTDLTKVLDWSAART